MVRCYLAGKITGIDREQCLIKFAAAHQAVKKAMPDVMCVNPMAIVPEGTDWYLAMRICIKSLVTCEYMYLCDDWEESEGARLEVIIAKKLGIKILKGGKNVSRTNG